MGTGTAQSRSQTSPAAFPPVRTLVQSRHSPEPSRLPRFPSALRFPGVQGGVRWDGWRRKTGREGKRRAPGALPRSCWRRDSSGAPCLPAPLIAAEHHLRNWPAGPGAPQAPAPAPPCRAAWDSVRPAGCGARASREGLRRAQTHARTLGDDPKAQRQGSGGGSRKSSRSRRRLGAAVMPGSASRGPGGGEGLL